MKFFRVAVPRWYSDCCVVREGPDGSLANLLVDDSEEAVGRNRKY